MDSSSRSVRFPSGHVLTTWDNHTTANTGQCQLRYTFTAPDAQCPACAAPVIPCTSLALTGWHMCPTHGAVTATYPVLFCGTEYGCAPSHAIDSDAALLGLLAFLCLRRGDTDADYFAEYTAEQTAWSQSSACATLACDVACAEEAGGCVCGMTWENVDDWDAHGGCSDRPTVTDFEVLDHGEDGSQYFPGCGTAHSKFAHVATGVGDTGAEALADALEDMAQVDATVSPLQERIMRDYVSEPDRNCHANCGDDCHNGDEAHDWHRYVSVRYNVREVK